MSGVLRQWDGTGWVDLLGDTALGEHTHVTYYTHIQTVPASVWDVIFDLPYMPSVTIVDSAGSVVGGDILIVGPGHYQLHFTAPFSGSAYLS